MFGKIVMRVTLIRNLTADGFVYELVSSESNIRTPNSSNNFTIHTPTLTRER